MGSGIYEAAESLLAAQLTGASNVQPIVTGKAVLGILLVRLLAALQRNGIIFWGTAISLPLKGILDPMFNRHLCIARTALATACVYVASALYLGITPLLALLRSVGPAGVIAASVAA